MFVCVHSRWSIITYRYETRTKKKTCVYFVTPYYFSRSYCTCACDYALFYRNPTPNQIKSIAKLIGSVQKPQIGRPKHVASMNGNATIINALTMTFCVMVPKIVQTTPMKGLFAKVMAQQVIVYIISFHFYHFYWSISDKALAGKIIII